jgi:hypothetical protein
MKLKKNIHSSDQLRKPYNVCIREKMKTEYQN